MSEEQNVATITKIYEAFGKGDVPYILSQLTDNVRWVVHQDSVVPMAGDWSGEAKVPGFFQAIGDNIDMKSFVPMEFVAQGDSVVSTGEMVCTARPTGKSADTKWIFVWKLHGGKVTSYEQFHSPELAEAFR